MDQLRVTAGRLKDPGQRQRAILSLAAAQLLAAVVVTAGVASPVGPVTTVVAAAAAWAFVGRFPLSIELGRDRCTVTLSELVLAIAVVHVSPVGLVLAAATGEALAVARYGVSAVKLAYNTCSRAFATAAAAVAFVVWPGAGGAAAAFTAVLVAATIDVLSTSAAISLSLGERPIDVVRRTAPPALVVAGAAGALGVVATELAVADAWLVVLLAPILALVAVTARTAATHRDERLRTERLYTAVAATTSGLPVGDLLVGIAHHAAALSGAGEVVVAVETNGRTHGAQVVEGRDQQPAPARLAEVLARAASPHPARELLVSVHGDQARLVVLTARRTSDADVADPARLSTLSAYASQAHLAVTNALLVEELREALEHQIDLNRRKDEFVATVSHELRTPLTAAITSIELVQRHTERLGPERAAGLLETATHEARRLHRLIDDLLTVAAIEQGGSEIDPERVDADDVVALLSSTADALLPGRVTVEVALSTPAVVADRGALERIVLNLLGNAAKYAGSARVDATIAPDGDGVVVAVADHGPGVPAEDAERIFERFVQLDQSSTREHGGTGLGLHLSRELARRMAGDLVHRPTPGGGATFALRLPAAADQPRTHDDATTPRRAVA